MLGDLSIDSEVFVFAIENRIRGEEWKSCRPVPVVQSLTAVPFVFC